MCVESTSIACNSNISKRQTKPEKFLTELKDPAMDAVVNDGLQLKRVAGGNMVQHSPLFSLDGSLLFVIYESSIQAFSVTTGDLVRSYESTAVDSPLIGMVLDNSQEKYIFACTANGLIISWKIDSGLLIDKIAVLKTKLVVESFHILYDQNGVSSFLVQGTSYKKLFFQYCPRKRMVLTVIRPAIHHNLKHKERNEAVPEQNDNDAENTLIKAAPGGYGLNFFAYIAKNRWYWVRLKPGVFVGSLPHCNRVQPVVVTCHPTEAIVAVGDTLGRIVLYRNFLTNEKVIWEAYHWHSNLVNCLVFSHNGTHLYSGGHERVLVKWIVGQEEKADQIPRLTDSILNIAIGPENLKLVICTADNGIQIMNALHKQTATVQSFSKISADVPAEYLFPAGLRVNPRTNTIIMNGRVGCIQFFSPHTKSMLYTLDITLRNYNTKEDNNFIQNTIVSNIGVNTHWLATVENWNDNRNSMETRLKFWRYNDSRQTYSLNTNLENVHQGAVHDLAFSSISRERDLQCATAGEDNCIKMWSLEEIETTDGGEKLVWTYVGSVQHRDLPVRSISFAQDASLLAGGFGNVLCIWNTDTLKLKCALSAPSGYDGCVNKAVMIIPAIGITKSRQLKETMKDNRFYDDACRNIIIEMVEQISGKGKNAVLDDVTEKYKKMRHSSLMLAVRTELVGNISENSKKNMMQRIQKNSKINTIQRAELLHYLHTSCRISDAMKIRIQSKLQASRRSMHKNEHLLKNICCNTARHRRFRVFRKHQNYIRRRLSGIPFGGCLSAIFWNENIDRMKLTQKGQSVKKPTVPDQMDEIQNPIRNFLHIQHVFFCCGQFSHLVIICTNNRLIVWNLLTLKMQVSVAIMIDCIAFDPITNLIASFTKDNELFVFLPNIPMPLYHRINMPKVFGAVWVPRRYPSSQSFNVDWQATSQLYFLNEKQELLLLVSDNDEESLGPIDSDDEEILIADEIVNQMSSGTKTAFSALLTKQAIGNNVQKNTMVRSDTFRLPGKAAVTEVVDSCSHTMAPVNVLCRDFLRSLLLSEENRTKESTLQNQQSVLKTAAKINGAVSERGFTISTGENSTVNIELNAEEVGLDKNMQLNKTITFRKATNVAVDQMKQNHLLVASNDGSIELKKLSQELIDIIF